MPFVPQKDPVVEFHGKKDLSPTEKNPKAKAIAQRLNNGYHNDMTSGATTEVKLRNQDIPSRNSTKN